MDFYGFYMGEEFEAWRYLGAQVSSHGTTFRTFAPNALRISLIGDFNQWQETPMEKIYDGNFWEVTVPEAKESMRYKYRIYRQDGSFLWITAIPMGFPLSFVLTMPLLSAA